LRGSLLDTSSNLALNSQGQFDGYRCHALEEQGTDGLINHATAYRLTGFLGAAHGVLGANVVRFELAFYFLISHPHAGAADAAHHTALQQAHPLAGKSTPAGLTKPPAFCASVT